MTTKVTPDLTTGHFRKNAIINGDFNVWQRGTSFAAIANAAYSADRWQWSFSGSMAHTISRSTDVPTAAQAGRLFNYSILVDCTTADAATAAGDYAVLIQNIEGYNWLPLAQRAFTLSFWVKATKTGTYCVSAVNSGNDRSYVAEYTVSVADTWEKKTITFTASPSAGTWDYTTGIGLRLNFTLACGSNFHGAAGSWNSAQDFATSNQVNACDDVANNFRIAGVQLEAGSVATEFEQRMFQDELALCQRYYEKSYEQGNVPGAVVNSGALEGRCNGTNHFETIHFAVPKRAAPTIAVYSPIDGQAAFWYDVTAASNRAAAFNISGQGRATISIAVSVDGALIRGHWTASAEL